MYWPHNTHNKTRESPRYIFYYFYNHSFFLFFNFLKNFKSSIIPLIFTFITDSFAKKKKDDPIVFLKQTSYIYFL